MAGLKAEQSGPMIRDTVLAFRTGTVGSLSGSRGPRSHQGIRFGRARRETLTQRHTGIRLQAVFQDALWGRDTRGQLRHEAQRIHEQLRGTRDTGDTRRKGIRRRNNTEILFLNKDTPSSSTGPHPGKIEWRYRILHLVTAEEAATASAELAVTVARVDPALAELAATDARVDPASAELAATDARVDPASAEEADPAPVAVADVIAELMPARRF